MPKNNEQVRHSDNFMDDVFQKGFFEYQEEVKGNNLISNHNFLNKSIAKGNLNFFTEGINNFFTLIFIFKFYNFK